MLRVLLPIILSKMLGDGIELIVSTPKIKPKRVAGSCVTESFCVGKSSAEFQVKSHLSHCFVRTLSRFNSMVAIAFKSDTAPWPRGQSADIDSAGRLPVCNLPQRACPPAGQTHGGGETIFFRKKINFGFCLIYPLSECSLKYMTQPELDLESRSK